MMYSQTSTSGAVETKSSLKALLRRHPIAGYFILAYSGTWLTLTPALLSKSGIGILPYSLPFALFAVLFILGGLAGPSLSAFIMTGATQGKAGVRTFLRRYVQWRVGPQWYVAALFGYVAVYIVVAVAALGTMPLHAFAQRWLLVLVAYLPAVLTFNLITAIGEEPGWRGYALPRLQEKYGPVGGSLILGTLHAGWHLPVFFLPALALGKLSLPYLAMWVPTIWATTVLWTWIYNHVKGSILIAALLHSSFDASGTLVFHQILNANSFSHAAALRINVAQTVILIGLGVLIVAATRGRLGYRHRRAAVADAATEPAEAVLVR